MSTPRSNNPATNVGSSRGKFANKNLNSTFKAPIRPGGVASRGSLLVLSNNKGRVKNVGVAAAPTPLNTPSLRRENKGKDINVNLIPIGSSGVWGQSSGEAKAQESTQEEQSNSSNTTRSAAPWSKLNSENPESDSQASKPPIRDWAADDSDDEEEEEEKAEQQLNQAPKPVLSSNQTPHSQLQPQYRGNVSTFSSSSEPEKSSWRSTSVNELFVAKEKEAQNWRAELRPQTQPSQQSPREMFPSSGFTAPAGPAAAGGGIDGGYQRRNYYRDDGQQGYNSRSYERPDNPRRQFTQYDNQQDREGRRPYYNNNQSHYDANGGGGPGRYNQPFQTQYTPQFQPNFNRYDPRQGQEFRRSSPRRMDPTTGPSPGGSGEWSRMTAPAPISSSQTAPNQSTPSSMSASTSAMSPEQLAEQRALEVARQERELLEQRKRLQEQRQREEEEQRRLEEEARKKEQERLEREQARREEQRRQEEQKRKEEEELRRRREEEQQHLAEQRMQEQRRLQEQQHQQQYHERPQHYERSQHQYEQQNPQSYQRGGARPNYRGEDRESSSSYSGSGRPERQWAPAQDRVDDRPYHRGQRQDQPAPNWQSQPLPSKLGDSQRQRPGPGGRQSVPGQQERPRNQPEGMKTYASLFPRPKHAPAGTDSRDSHEEDESAPVVDENDAVDQPAAHGPTRALRSSDESSSRSRSDAANKMLYDPKANRLVKPTDQDQDGDNRRKLPNKRRYDEDQEEQQQPPQHSSHGSEVATSRTPTQTWRKPTQTAGSGSRTIRDAREGDGSGFVRDRDREKDVEHEEAAKRRREESRRDADEAREKLMKARQAEAEARREARTKERLERPPRTKGVLFQYDENGELEQVLSQAEIAERAVKRELYLEHQRQLQEKTAQREVEKKEREREREREKKPERTEKQRDREIRSRRDQKVTDDVAVQEEPPFNRRTSEERVRKGPPPEESNRHTEYSGRNEPPSRSTDFTEVRNRRTKLQEKDKKIIAPISKASRVIIKIDKKLSKDKATEDTSARKSTTSADKPALAVPAKPAWKDPQATLEKIGVISPVTVPHTEPAEVLQMKNNVETTAPVLTLEAKEFRRGKREKERDNDRPSDRDRDRDRGGKERRKPVQKPEVEEGSGRFSANALRSALQQPQPPAHASYPSSSAPQSLGLDASGDAPVMTYRDQLPMGQPDAVVSSPAHAQSHNQTQIHPQSMDRNRDDETNLDIQRMAEETSVGRRNPSTYPTFIPGVGLSNIDMQPDTPWGQQGQGPELLLQGRGGSDLSLYGNPNRVEIGGWSSLGAFSNYIIPNSNSNATPWNYASEQNIYAPSTFLVQNSAPPSQWPTQFGSEHDAIKVTDPSSTNTFLGGLGGTPVQYGFGGYSMGEISIGGGSDITIETTSMTRGINSLLMVDNSKMDNSTDLSGGGSNLELNDHQNYRDGQDGSDGQNNDGYSNDRGDDGSGRRGRGRGRGRSERGGRSGGRSSERVSFSSSSRGRGRGVIGSPSDSSEGLRGRGRGRGRRGRGSESDRGYSEPRERPARYPYSPKESAEGFITSNPTPAVDVSEGRNEEHTQPSRSTRLRRRPDEEETVEEEYEAESRSGTDEDDDRDGNEQSAGAPPYSSSRGRGSRGRDRGRRGSSTRGRSSRGRSGRGSEGRFEQSRASESAESSFVRPPAEANPSTVRDVRDNEDNRESVDTSSRGRGFGRGRGSRRGGGRWNTDESESRGRGRGQGSYRGGRGAFVESGGRESAAEGESRANEAPQSDTQSPARTERLSNPNRGGIAGRAFAAIRGRRGRGPPAKPASAPPS